MNGPNGRDGQAPSTDDEVHRNPVNLNKSAPATTLGAGDTGVSLEKRPLPEEGAPATREPVDTASVVPPPVVSPPVAPPTVIAPPVVAPPVRSPGGPGRPVDPETTGSGKRRLPWLIGSGLVVAGLLAGAVTGVVLSGGSDDPDPEGRPTSAQPGADDGLGGADDTTSPDDSSVGDDGDLATTDDLGGHDPETDAQERLQFVLAEDADDVAALEGYWTAQLSSSAPGDTAANVVAKYDELVARYPDAVLAWSGDWPGSFGPSSLSSWVVLSGEAHDTTRPVLDWCHLEGLGDGDCWAKRLATSGDDPNLNTDHWPADDRNN